VPHPIKGEEVKAFVVLKPGQTATADDLIAFCREQLAPFKVPKAIEFREALPKTLIGKGPAAPARGGGQEEAGDRDVTGLYVPNVETVRLARDDRGWLRLVG